MNPSEIKARVASLLDLPLSHVILKHAPGKTPTFENRGEYFYIEYDDEKTLTHEFLHSCFTPPIACKNHLFNALEDYRISQKAKQYDPKLAEANNTVFTDEQYKRIPKSIEHEDLEIQRSIQMASIMAMPEQIDIQPLMDELNFPRDLKQAMATSREQLSQDPSLQTLNSTFNLLDYWAKYEEEETNHPNFSYDENISSLEKPTKESVERNLKRNTFLTTPTLNPTEEFLLKKAIQKIIQNKSIGKRQYTITGKLKTKRLGRMPSNYLFEKKTAPKPETKLYVLGDCSGSMRGAKIEIVHAFFNSMREMEIPNFQLELRMFNSLMFKNDDIPKDADKFHKSLMELSYESPCGTGELASWNDDPHFLKEVVQEILQDPTPNKSLLILSDGRPELSHNYEEKDLKQIVQTVLIPSKIPYMSVGILSHAVEDYYPQSRVCSSTQELINTLYQNTKMLINI